MMDDLSVLVKNVKDVKGLTGRRWDNVLRVIKLNPAKQLARLLELKPHWKNPLAFVFAGERDVVELDLLSVMLQLGADPSESLIYAVATSRECCELLFKHGAEPNFHDKDGWTALHQAICEKSVSDCEMLLQRGADPNIRHTDKIWFDDVVRFFVSAHKSSVHAQTGRTALHEAVLTKSQRLCELLLRHGADPNLPTTGEYGSTPLHLAASHDLPSLCKVLLLHGANPETLDTEGDTPLRRAVKGNAPDCCEILLAHGVDLENEPSPPLLFEAVEREFDSMCEWLLNLGCDPNEVHNKNTPLQVAAHLGYDKCCELLLQFGADPDVLTRDKETVLHRAVYSGSASCCEVLLQYHCDPNKQDCHGFTPLHRAALQSFAECCEVLVAYGADPIVEDSKDRLPLQLAKPDDEPTAFFLIGHYFDFDEDLFRKLCQQGKTAVLRRYLDNFRIVPNPPRQRSRVKVYYHDLHRFYGMPSLPIDATPLYQVLNGPDEVPSLVDHPVFEHVLNLKWAPYEKPADTFGARWFLTNMLGALKFLIALVLSVFFTPEKTFVRDLEGFARHMYIGESMWFLAMLVSSYWSFVSPDVVSTHWLSMVMAVLLLMLEALDWNKRRWLYFKDGTNCINLIAYGGVFVLAVAALVDPKLPHVDIARAVLIVLLSFCGLEYLRMVPLTSLLIAITFKMIQDVIKFVVLYGVFQIGFSGAFFLLFHDEDSRYNTYAEAFLATFFMLFGDFDSDMFLHLDGAKAVVANVLVLLYLIGAMVMLMNLLIAMMSTSYQEVLDSAKVARSIGRAEMILRMEGLLPHIVREYKFDESFSLKGRENAAKVRAEFDVERAENGESPPPSDDDLFEIDAVKAEGSELSGDESARSSSSDGEQRVSQSSAPLLPASPDSQDSSDEESDSELGDAQATSAKATEERPPVHTTSSSDQTIEHPLRPQPASRVFQPKSKKKQKEPSMRISDQLKIYSEYFDAGSGRPQLDDSVVLEYVDGTDNIQKDLQQVHEKLEAKLDNSQEQMAQQLDVLAHQLQQLQQDVQQLRQHQEQQANQLAETVLVKLNDLQRQIVSNGSSAVTSPSKRFSFKRQG